MPFVQNVDQTPVRILSLDGGGIRGESQLHMLKELMVQVQSELALSNQSSTQRGLVKPCEFFDLICGTGTGGLIALMLGRLEMVRNKPPIYSFG